MLNAAVDNILSDDEVTSHTATADRGIADGGASFESEMQMNERHIAEMLELSCQQTGVNCAQAKLVRRQYEESYGR